MERRRRSTKRLRKVDAWLGLYRQEQERRVKAVTIIQKAWRRWLDIGVFGYYKELIGFRKCGEPCQLMKCIDPKEAEYLDAAAGVHIRFRLGGLTFPPNIYYKIYTHRPVVDLCANSPKDYAKLAVKKWQSGKHQKESDEDRSGWYKRIENNGWRLLSIRFWKALDPLTAEDNDKVKEFQVCRVRKKQDVERTRKMRKIKWLKKMYFAEKLQARTVDPKETLLIARVTEGFCKTVRDEVIDSVMEWEVDEMLKWTTALNYDDYVKQWKELGTSNISEAFQGFQFTEQRYDSFDLSKIPEMLKKIADSPGRSSRGTTPYN
ncbi:protein MFI [Tiliqua scincoides]|uniref:protein MFI n=1 Tax=Tiliqua scincoides TaxID=71010 RepID=UPI003462F73E